MLYFRAMTAFNEETETVERWIKIGKTKKPARRENEYNVHNPVVKVIGTKTGYTKAEKAEHAKLEKLGFERAKRQKRRMVQIACRCKTVGSRQNVTV